MMKTTDFVVKRRRPFMGTVEATGQSDNNYVKIADKIGKTICRVPCGEGDSDIYQYIVASVNSYPRAIKLLKFVLEHLAGGIVGPETEYFSQDEQEAWLRSTIMDFLNNAGEGITT